MVTTTEVGQLAGECQGWLTQLRTFRENFHQYKSRLQDMAADQTQRDTLLEIEHLDNQFHIQLINIHDLKHSIKRHVQKVTIARDHHGFLPDDLLARHEFLFDDFQRLETTLQIISREFERFGKYLQVA